MPFGTVVDTPPINSTDSPPKKRGRPKGSTRIKASKDKIAGKLTGTLTMVAGFVAVKDQFDAAVIAANAEKMGSAYADVIIRHPKAVKLLDRAEIAEGYGAAILVTLAVAIPIALHHNYLPESLRPLAQIFGAPEMAPSSGEDNTMRYAA